MSEIIKKEEKKIEKETQEVASVESFISRAIEMNAPIETIEKLLAMRKELKAERAKEDFDFSMSIFQKECPIIKKTKTVPTRSGAVAYSYAPLEEIVKQTKEIIAGNGFSYKIETITGEGKVKAICIVKHRSGHSESSDVEVPLGNKTDVMSNSQVVAAAITFAKRYAFCNAFGVLTGDEDDEKKISKDTEPVSVKAIEKLKKAHNADELKDIWTRLSAKEKQDDEVVAYKDELKTKLL